MQKVLLVSTDLDRNNFQHTCLQLKIQLNIKQSLRKNYNNKIASAMILEICLETREGGPDPLSTLFGLW